MKRLLLLIFLVGFIHTCLAKERLKITEQDTIVGKNKVTQQQIIAKEIKFPSLIYKALIDTTANLLSLELRDLKKSGKHYQSDGTFLVYDIANKTEKWSRTVDYSSFRILQAAQSLVFSSKDRSYAFNIETGALESTIPNQISYVDGTQKIGLGYISGAFNEKSNKLLAYDLTRGKKIWKSQVKKNYGWNGVYHLKDSSLMIVASGLHKYNLKNGKGWDLSLFTGFKDYTGETIINTTGLIVGAFTGVYFFSLQPDLITDMVSNVVDDSSNLYIAVSDEVLKINYNGNPMWTAPLSDDTTGSSTIFIRDNTLYLVNSGYAYMNNQRIYYGLPFFAAFNKNTGEKLFFNVIANKRTFIHDFKIVKDTIYFVLSNDSLVKCLLKNGSILLNKSLHMQLGGSIVRFTNPYYFYKKNDEFITPLISDPINQYFTSDLGSVYVLSPLLNYVNTIYKDEVGIEFFEDSNFRFIKNNQKTMVVNTSNKIVAELNIDDILNEKDGILYGIKGNNIYEIKLSEFGGI